MKKRQEATKYAISIDWLQVSGRMPSVPNSALPITGYNGNPPFVPCVDLKDSHIYSPVFKEVKDIIYCGMTYAQIMYCPRSSALKFDLACIKLENRVLYSQERIVILYQIAQALGFEICGITRLDLCYDCNVLANGEDPGAFLLRYLVSKPGERGHLHRKGSTRFCANGSRSWYKDAKVTSMRFGSDKTAIGAYVYNKTLELAEVKDKPWIRAMWERAGLCSTLAKEYEELTDREKEKMINYHTLAGYCTESVWRFEVSIKCQGADLLRLSDKQLFKLSVSDMENQADIEELFYIYAAKAFDFRENTGQKNIRYYKPVNLFETQSVGVNYRPVKTSKCLGSGRTEKICANKLNKLMQTYHDITPELAKSLIQSITFLKKVAGVKDNELRNLQYAKYLDNLKCTDYYSRAFKDSLNSSIASNLAKLEYLLSMPGALDSPQEKKEHANNQDRKNTPPKAEEYTNETIK